MEKIIEVINVTKTFVAQRVKTRALNSVHLDVHCGDYLSIVGPSGSGKSSLLNILSLIDQPSEGKVKYFGKVAGSLNGRELAEIRNQKIGFVFQTFNLLGHLTVFENIALPLKYSRNKSSNIDSIIIPILERLGIAHRSDHYPHQLSGGQQQRVAIGRAIVNRPAIIFADEPTGNLDENSSNDVINVLEELNSEGATLCVVTHDFNIANRAKRQIKIDSGNLAEVIKLEE